MCCNSAPAAPDYSSLANASEESARIMADLGREQLAATKEESSANRAALAPIFATQARISEQSANQGDDYYANLVKTYRPIEESLARDATDAGSQQLQDEAAARAVADSQGTFTRDTNQIIRAGKRYGMSPSAIVSSMGAMAGDQASRTVAATTAARDKEKQLGYAKKLDVAGIGRNLPGASTGAYVAATGAGSSAAGTQMAPSNQLLSGMATAAGITGTGQQIRNSGLSTIAGLQSQNYNAALSADSTGFGSLLGGLGGIGQGLGALKTAGIFS